METNVDKNTPGAASGGAARARVYFFKKMLEKINRIWLIIDSETSHPPLGPGLVPGPQMKGFPLELFQFRETLKTQALYHYIIPQTDLSVGVLTVLLRGLGWGRAPLTLPGSILVCNLHYLVI